MLLFNRKVNVLRPVSTDDDFGSQIQVIGITTINLYQLPCRINESGFGVTGKVFGRKGLPCTHDMFCGVVDIVEDDRVDDGSRVYEVLNVTNWNNKFLKIRLGLVK